MIAICLALLAAPATEAINLTIDGVKREATLVRPTKGTGLSPAVLCFHGHGGNMRYSQRSYQIDREWPEATVVYLQGIPTKTKNDPAGNKNGWQTNIGEFGDRDLKFVDAVLARLRKSASVDMTHVFAMGHSNGARFSLVLWQARPKAFAGFGAFCGPIPMGSFVPKPAFIAAGRTDPIVRFAGMDLTIKRIKEINGLPSEGKPVNEFITRYDSPGKPELMTYIHDGGHTFPKDAVAPLVEFFKRQVKS